MQRSRDEAVSEPRARAGGAESGVGRSHLFFAVNSRREDSSSPRAACVTCDSRSANSECCICDECGAGLHMAATVTILKGETLDVAPARPSSAKGDRPSCDGKTKFAIGVKQARCARVHGGRDCSMARACAARAAAGARALAKRFRGRIAVLEWISCCAAFVCCSLACEDSTGRFTRTEPAAWKQSAPFA
eukprot:6182602-Pleurochrysis_carterae.AAC.2